MPTRENQNCQLEDPPADFTTRMSSIRDRNPNSVLATPELSGLQGNHRYPGLSGRFETTEEQAG